MTRLIYYGNSHDLSMNVHSLIMEQAHRVVYEQKSGTHLYRVGGKTLSHLCTVRVRPRKESIVVSVIPHTNYRTTARNLVSCIQKTLNN